MTDLDELLRRQEVGARSIVRGVIANTPADVEDDLFVTVPAFDGSRVQWGPCPWSPSSALPLRGDDCLLLFDEQDTPWVIVLAPVEATGEPGPQGPEGPQGPPGPTGATGPAGAPGAQGPTGATGPQGPQGAKGDTGATGAQGPQGDPGATGAQGPKGDTGAQGPAGATGAQGPKGDTGAQGVQGPTGATGSQGPQGVPGATGTPGSVWRTGSGAPAGATGIVGDWWLDSASGDYYEKTGASAYTLRGNLKGPQGAQGIQGIQGPAGPSGASTFLAAPGPPTAGVGVDGAIYLDTTSNRLWGPKAAGAWPGTALGRVMPLAPTYAQVTSG